MSRNGHDRIREALGHSVQAIDAEPDLVDLDRRRARSDRRRARALVGATVATFVVVITLLVGTDALHDGPRQPMPFQAAGQPSASTVSSTVPSTSTVPPIPPPDEATGGSDTTCPPAKNPTTDQATVRNQINSARANQERGSLAVCSWAQNKAQSWADHLAQIGTLEHSDLNSGYPGNLGCFSNAGNVGYGPDLDSIHNQFLNSSIHRDNMLGPQYQYVGTGVAKNTATGDYFVVHEYLGLC